MKQHTTYFKQQTQALNCEILIKKWLVGLGYENIEMEFIAL